MISVDIYIVGPAIASTRRKRGLVGVHLSKRVIMFCAAREGPPRDVCGCSFASPIDRDRRRRRIHRRRSCRAAELYRDTALQPSGARTRFDDDDYEDTKTKKIIIMCTYNILYGHGSDTPVSYCVLRFFGK